jgi:F-type H+/Na+-transporting ATPase subunit alpha
LLLHEQVAVIYAGINGYLDEIDAEKVVAFNLGLREYLKTSKPKYVEIVQGKKVLDEEAEGLLKEGITEYQKAFAA